MNFTYPVSEAEYVLALIEHNVEDHHDGESDVEAEDGRCGVKVSIICDKHPGGEYQNPRYAAGRHSHYNRIMELSYFTLSLDSLTLLTHMDWSLVFGHQYLHLEHL